MTFEIEVEEVKEGLKYKKDGNKHSFYITLHRFTRKMEKFNMLVVWENGNVKLIGDENAIDTVKNLLTRRDSAGSVIWCLVQNEYRTLERLEEKVEKLQNASIHEYSQALLHDVMSVKKSLFRMHMDLIKLRNIVEGVIDESVDVEEFKKILRDLNELIYVCEYLIDGTTVAIQLMQNTLGARMNEIMKILTVIATIMMPLTLITGIYGMNFKNIPELSWSFGYYYSLALMLTIAVAMLYYFRSKKLI